jgi:hypothetical protein
MHLLIACSTHRIYLPEKYITLQLFMLMLMQNGMHFYFYFLSIYIL